MFRTDRQRAESACRKDGAELAGTQTQPSQRWSDQQWQQRSWSWTFVSSRCANAGIQPRRTAPNKGARFARFVPAKSIIADFCFVFQKCSLAHCKAGD